MVDGKPAQTGRLLDAIESPADVKRIKADQLPVLAREIRELIINTVSQTGGHLGSSLGAVELTIALHYVFETPRDKIIWDVGHQCYPHKILTGRKRQFGTIRQYLGLSGFPRISESEHDAYGTGHASTSISAAMGFAVGRDLKQQEGEVIAVIGDGAFTGGNALEAVNQAGYLSSKVIVVLNDNRMSISRNVGALSDYTHRIEKTEKYRQVRDDLYELIERETEFRKELISLKDHVKEIGAPGLLFEKLGFNYLGPVDGHDFSELLAALRSAKSIPGPVLIHLRTCKGKGYGEAEKDASRFHGVSPFDISSGKNSKSSAGKSFTGAFSDTLVELARQDERVLAITAAMTDGTGLNEFKKAFPGRFFDVGIAEQHAVVFAAGLARQGFVPICAIYSTFLQRAYDAVIHDVCLQQLPVVFALDRAGLVGNDGPTHHGCFDLSFLRAIPGLTVMAPKDGNELRDMLVTAVQWGRPTAIRYPRGSCGEFHPGRAGRALPVGDGEVIRDGSQLTVVSIGAVLPQAQRACQELEMQGISPTLINARFVKPIDDAIADRILETGKAIVIEENALQGGFGSAVLELCQSKNVMADIIRIGVPDRFIDHGEQQLLRKDCGLTWENIVLAAKQLLGEFGSDTRPGSQA